MTKFKTQDEIQSETLNSLGEHKLTWDQSPEFRNTRTNPLLLRQLLFNFFKANHLSKPTISLNEAQEVISHSSNFINNHEHIPSKLVEVELDSSKDPNSVRFVYKMKDSKMLRMGVETNISTSSQGRQLNLNAKLQNVTGNLDSLEVQLGSSGFKSVMSKGDRALNLVQNIPQTKYMNKYTNVSSSQILNYNSLFVGGIKLNENQKGYNLHQEGENASYSGYYKYSLNYIDLMTKDLSNSVKFEHCEAQKWHRLGGHLTNNFGKIRTEQGVNNKFNKVFGKLEFLKEIKYDMNRFCSFTSQINTGILISNNKSPVHNLFNSFHLQDLHGCRNIGSSTDDGTNYLGTSNYINIFNKLNVNIGGLFSKGIQPQIQGGLQQGKNKDEKPWELKKWKGAAGIGFGQGSDWLLDISQNLFNFNTEESNTNPGLKIRFYPFR